MNLILTLKELWRRRALVAVALVAAAAISVALVFQVGVSPPSLSKRSQTSAQGSIEILVDSARSPIADARRDLGGLTARAGVFARYISGGNVIGRIAKANRIPVKRIDVAGPTPLPGQAPGVEQAPPNLNPYGIAVTQPEELPIITVLTRAPTVRAARGMAAATPAAIRQVVRTIQARQDTPLDKRVQFRVLGPAQAGLVDDSLGKKVAGLLFIVFAAIFVALILGVPRLAAAWRAAGSDIGAPDPEEGAVGAPAVVRLPAGRGEDAHAGDREPGRIGQREEA